MPAVSWSLDLDRSEMTLDFVISSYAPTLKALMSSRLHAPQLSSLTDGFNVLGSAMETTPTMRQLPHAREELDTIVDKIKQKLPYAKIMDTSHAAEVFESLPESQIALFVCHGLSDPRAPSQSFLGLLHKPNGSLSDSPPTLEKLTVSRLAENDLNQACIAFLSACSTADNRAKWLADEVLHLASGFLVAGFRHVIASMWPVLDEVSPAFAGMFWETMLQKPVTEWQDRDVSVAVHRATIFVRDDEDFDIGMQPLAWAPYVHWGA
jgi:CHAT domain-containing protein